MQDILFNRVKEQAKAKIKESHNRFNPNTLSINQTKNTFYRFVNFM